MPTSHAAAARITVCVATAEIVMARLPGSGLTMLAAVHIIVDYYGADTACSAGLWINDVGYRSYYCGLLWRGYCLLSRALD